MTITTSFYGLTTINSEENLKAYLIHVVDNESGDSYIAGFMDDLLASSKKMHPGNHIRPLVDHAVFHAANTHQAVRHLQQEGLSDGKALAIARNSMVIAMIPVTGELADSLISAEPESFWHTRFAGEIKDAREALAKNEPLLVATCDGSFTDSINELSERDSSEIEGLEIIKEA